MSHYSIEGRNVFITIHMEENIMNKFALVFTEAFVFAVAIMIGALVIG
jgi:hypothetical protein